MGGVAAFFRRVFGAVFGPVGNTVFDTVSGYFGLPLVLNDSFNQKNILVFRDTFDNLDEWTVESGFAAAVDGVLTLTN